MLQSSADLTFDLLVSDLERTSLNMKGGRSWEQIIVIVIVCAAGALGGVVNALMTDAGVILPKTDEQGIWKAGMVGNIVVSAVAV